MRGQSGIGSSQGFNLGVQFGDLRLSLGFFLSELSLQIAIFRLDLAQAAGRNIESLLLLVKFTLQLSNLGF